ncbi:MAG TPA: ABC transporter substrate-binding protein, partial [Gammaproteobacteria bacterium]|nr:ABC transporter substrate-binding protein [Gammaproteobacteria bacterium]
MNPRLVLLLAPLLLLAGLVQAYFWVPKYDQQTRATPSRLETFIEGESADAKILNPILHADSQSGRIVTLVFDGLLDLDENLNLRGRLARNWETTEVVFLVVDESQSFPDGVAVTAERLKARINRARASEDFPELTTLVQSVELIEGGALLPLEPDADTADTRQTAPHRLRFPPRIRLELTRVEPDILALLAPVLGPDYAAGFDPGRYLLSTEGLSEGVLDALQTRLPLVEHNPVIEFRLRRNVRFHDGHPLTSEDVRFTYEAIMEPKNLSPRTSDFEPIKSVEAVEPHLVRVTYKRLFSPAVNVWTIGILPAHLLKPELIAREAEDRGLVGAAAESFGLRDSSFNRSPVGTGPFRFVEWQGDELIKLTRNDDYWDGPAIYRDYYFRIIPDPLTKELEFRAGAIDSYQLQPFQVTRFETSPRYRTLSGLGSGYTYIGYNNRLPLFSDARVRRALGMAINVDEIIRYVMYGEGERTTGPYPKKTDWYDEGIAPLPYDPEGALRLLESLGWRKNEQGLLEKDGEIFEFNLITNHGNLIRKAILSVAQNSWKRIGVKVNTQVFEWAVFLEDFVNPGRFDAVILGWLMGVDPDLYQIWHSSQSGRNQLNFVGYKSADADRIIEALRREYDRDNQVML